VASTESLIWWEKRLEDSGVPHSSLAAARSVSGATVLVFRDPDNIQLEFFLRF
jgi:hypothetical protein